MRQLLIIVSLLLLLTIIGTVGLHFLAELSWLESIYMAVVTLTTTGSQDIPHRTGAMIFVILYLVCGLGVFTYGAFQMGQILVNANFRRILEGRRMQRELNSLTDHYIVCGAGRMGVTICEYLASRRQPFVVIDRAEEKVDTLFKPRRWRYLVGDATSDEVLKQAGIERARALATVLATDADNVYVVLSARILSTSMQIVARASDAGAIQKLQRAGATRVISPFSSGGVKMARLMLSPRIEDFLEFTDEGGREFEIVEVQIDENSPYLGQTLAQTDLQQQGIMVIGIRRASGQHILAPDRSAVIQAGDSLFAFGRPQAVDTMGGEEPTGLK